MNRNFPLNTSRANPSGFWVFSLHLTPAAEIQREFRKIKFIFSFLHKKKTSVRSSAITEMFLLFTAILSNYWLAAQLLSHPVSHTHTQRLAHKHTLEIWECVRPLFLLTQSSWPQGVEGLFTRLTRPTQTHSNPPMHGHTHTHWQQTTSEGVHSSPSPQVSG